MSTDGSTTLLRRLERGALLWTVLAGVVVLILAPRRTDVMLGVAGGGLLSIVSFYAIRASVDAVMLAGRSAAPAEAGDATARSGPGLGGVLLKLAGRYALLGLLAYVMIARLRLHPLGLLVGVTALAASATFEAIRGLGGPGRAS